MEKLVNDLNTLLARERGIVEAAAELIDELSGTDPDIADSARDVQENARWICSGLYHRLNQLGAGSTLDSADTSQKLAELPDAIAKIQLVCDENKHTKRAIEVILHDDSPDDDTREFLKEALDTKQDSLNWCASTLGQWKIDR